MLIYTKETVKEGYDLITEAELLKLDLINTPAEDAEMLSELIRSKYAHAGEIFYFLLRSNGWEMKWEGKKVWIEKGEVVLDTPDDVVEAWEMVVKLALKESK